MRIEQLWKRGSTWALMLASGVCAVGLAWWASQPPPDMTDQILNRAAKAAGLEADDPVRAAIEFARPIRTRLNDSRDWQRIRRLRSNSSAVAPSAETELAELRTLMQPDPDQWLTEFARLAPWLPSAAEFMPHEALLIVLPTIEADAAAGRWEDATRRLRVLSATSSYSYLLDSGLAHTLATLLRLQPDTTATAMGGRVAVLLNDSLTTDAGTENYADRIAMACVERLRERDNDITAAWTQRWIFDRFQWCRDLEMGARLACEALESTDNGGAEGGRARDAGFYYLPPAHALLSPLTRAPALQRRIERALRQCPLVLEDVRRARAILGDADLVTAVRLLYGERYRFGLWGWLNDRWGYRTLAVTEFLVVRAAYAARLHYLRTGAWPENMEAVQNEIWPPARREAFPPPATFSEYLSRRGSKPWTPIVAAWVPVTQRLVASRFSVPRSQVQVTPAPDHPGKVDATVSVEFPSDPRGAVYLAEAVERLYGESLRGAPEILPKWAEPGQQPPLDRAAVLASTQLPGPGQTTGNPQPDYPELKVVIRLRLPEKIFAVWSAGPDGKYLERNPLDESVPAEPETVPGKPDRLIAFPGGW